MIKQWGLEQIDSVATRGEQPQSQHLQQLPHFHKEQNRAVPGLGAAGMLLRLKLQLHWLGLLL